MTLTQNGFNRITDLVARIFEYINMIRNSEINRSLFDELKRVNQVKFQYQEKANDLGRSLAHLAENLFEFDYEDVLYADYNFDEYNVTLINGIFDQFVPENCIFFIGANKDIESNPNFKEYFQGVSHKIEKIYKTKYWVTDFPKKELINLKQIENKNYKLMENNRFITNLTNYTSCLDEVKLNRL